MDFGQMIIDHPILAILTVLPLVALGAAIKIGITLFTGPPEDDAET